MNLPFGLELLEGANPEVAATAVLDQSGRVLSIEAQIRLHELFEYVETSRGILREISGDLVLAESDSANCSVLRTASERLERFCLEADSWGFGSLYEVGMGVQVLLIDFGGRIRNPRVRDTLHRGLAMLSALLDQCESDYRWRLAVAETLDCIDEASRD